MSDPDLDVTPRFDVPRHPAGPVQARDLAAHPGIALTMSGLPVPAQRQPRHGAQSPSAGVQDDEGTPEPPAGLQEVLQAPGAAQDGPGALAVPVRHSTGRTRRQRVAEWALGLPRDSMVLPSTMGHLRALRRDMARLAGENAARLQVLQTELEIMRAFLREHRLLDEYLRRRPELRHRLEAEWRHTW